MRIRSTKPEFWSSEDIARLRREDRLLFLGLWSYVDDNGVGRDDYRLIVADLFPLDDPVEARQYVRDGLATLSRAALIARYTVAGRAYLFVTGWRHQRIDKPGKPRYQLPPDDWRPPPLTSENGSAGRSSRECRESVARVPGALDTGTNRTSLATGLHGGSPVQPSAGDDQALTCDSGESRESLAPVTGEQGNRGTGEQGNPPTADMRARLSTTTHPHAGATTAAPPARPLPDEWRPTDTHRRIAERANVDVDHEADQFRAHAAAHGRTFVNPHEAFRLWLGNARPRPAHLQPVPNLDSAAAGDRPLTDVEVADILGPPNLPQPPNDVAEKGGDACAAWWIEEAPRFRDRRRAEALTRLQTKAAAR